uniref:HMG box domain-containing protein n=1 Tax=Caenorhabditis tropicalis TaxID=1561998 RepID=A0A1I7U5E4_9PELO
MNPLPNGIWQLFDGSDELFTVPNLVPQVPLLVPGLPPLFTTSFDWVGALQRAISASEGLRLPLSSPGSLSEHSSSPDTSISPEEPLDLTVPPTPGPLSFVPGLSPVPLLPSPMPGLPLPMFPGPLASFSLPKPETWHDVAVQHAWNSPLYWDSRIAKKRYLFNPLNKNKRMPQKVHLFNPSAITLFKEYYWKKGEPKEVTKENWDLLTDSMRSEWFRLAHCVKEERTYQKNKGFIIIEREH